MRRLPLEPAERVRRALFPVQGNQFGWRVASVTVSLLSVVLIALTLGYRFRSAEIPPALLLALLLTFATVVVLLSKFLFWAQREEGEFQGAYKTTEHEFQSVYENALDTILILDDQGICREANPAAEQLFGVRRRELIGESLDRFSKESGQFREVWKLLLIQKFHEGDAEFQKTDRSPVFVEFTAKADCLPGQHVMILRDVTERRRAQLSLLESEERFQQMARNIQEIFWMIDAETKKALFVNPAYEAITGRSCQSLHDDPTSYEDLIHPEDRVHVLAKLDEATRTGNFNEKFRILCAQGAIRWVWVRGFPVRDAAGKILRLVGTALEITAQKEAEEQVATNLALAKSAWAEAEALRKATLSLTQDLRMNFVMDALLKSLEDLVPYTCARVLIPEGGPHVLALGERNCPEPEKKSSRFPLAFMADESSFFHRVLMEQKSILIPDTKAEEKWQTFKGHKHLRSWLSAPLVASGEYLGCLSVGHAQPNLYTQEHLRRAELLAIPAAAAIQNAKLYETARIYGEALESRLNSLKKAETALAQSEDSRRSTEDKFQKVFRSSPIPFSITTFKEGRFVDVNAAFERRYGYTRAEVLGHTVHELRMWEDPADRDLMLAQLSKGGPIQNVMTRLRMKSGEIKITAYSADKIQFEGQSCILAVSEDLPQIDPHKSN
ncbi:MAG TPA: PAS domain S-box protein [Candidatus Sulfotelmatobacter sp.]|nr:PAS domain S-box protein [Candidatus Sulfotelmatobacter sp.]